jgi:hypothetical protein
MRNFLKGSEGYAIGHSEGYAIGHDECLQQSKGLIFIRFGVFGTLAEGFCPRFTLNLMPNFAMDFETEN